jgi:type I restriction enzyme S subunit
MNPTEPFKTTEIGDFPKSWEISRLGDLFDVQQGKALSQKARRGVSPRPFLRTANVLWGKVDLTTVDRMDFTEEEAARLSLRTGDLLVCEGGEIGRSAVWNHPDNGFSYQNHIHRLRKKTDGILPEFVMYWMQAAFLLLRLYGGVGNKTTIPNLSGTRLKQLLVPVPPLPEQRAIAAVLSKIQAAVEVQDKIVVTLKELKAVTMAKLFHEGLRGEPLKQTEIGEIPQSWKVVPLGMLLQLAQYGLSLRGEQSGTYPILRMNCQDDGRVVFRDLQFVDLDNDIFETFKLHDGDILFNRTNSYELVGRTAIFHEKVDAVFASYLIRLRVDENVTIPDFINYYFNLDKTQAALKALATRGVSQSNISASKLKLFQIPVPSKDEQSQIAMILDRLPESLQAAIRKRDAISSLFSSMLHLLMTGQVRVNSLNPGELIKV